MNSKKQTVLVADDDPRLLKLIQRNLEIANYRVVTVSDGPSVLRQAESEEPDLYVLDIMMPGLDGREVTLPHLLSLAGVVERDDLHRLGIVEVGDGRVVEGEVPVLADPQDGQRGPRLAQERRVAPALRLRIGRFAGQAVEGAHGHVGEEPIDQEAAEGGRKERPAKAAPV